MEPTKKLVNYTTMRRGDLSGNKSHGNALRIDRCPQCGRLGERHNYLPRNGQQEIEYVHTATFYTDYSGLRTWVAEDHCFVTRPAK